MKKKYQEYLENNILENNSFSIETWIFFPKIALIVVYSLWIWFCDLLNDKLHETPVWPLKLTNELDLRQMLLKLRADFSLFQILQIMTVKTLFEADQHTKQYPLLSMTI